VANLNKMQPSAQISAYLDTIPAEDRPSTAFSINFGARYASAIAAIIEDYNDLFLDFEKPPAWMRYLNPTAGDHEAFGKLVETYESATEKTAWAEAHNLNWQLLHRAVELKTRLLQKAATFSSASRDRCLPLQTMLAVAFGRNLAVWDDDVRMYFTWEEVMASLPTNSGT
jgi:hypothetical protein